MYCIIKSVFMTFQINWKKFKNIIVKYPEKIQIHNKEEYEIEHIDNIKNLITLTNGETLHVELINDYFQPDFARTIDSFQGDCISQDFGIVGLKNPYFILERLNSAIGRAKCKDYVHVDFYDENKIFEPKKYPDQVYINTELKTDDYSKIWFYSVWYENKLIYIGSTSQTIEQRMEQHYNDKSNDKFHKWLRNTNRDDVIVCPIYDVDVELNNLFNKPMVFENWGEIEDFEMNLVQKYNPLLNTRRKTERQEIIQIEEPKLTNTLTIEQYNSIKYYEKEEVFKEIIPRFTDIKNKKIIRLKYYHKGEHFVKEKGYAKIGYDKAKEELNIWFNEQVEKIKMKEINNENKPIEIDDNEYDDDKIWIEIY